jgi:uncharacterized protein YyaL (SSP411 family)
VPSLVLAGAGSPSGDGIALLEGREPLQGQATAYVCRHFACELPVTDGEELADQLERAAAPAVNR